MKLKNLTNIVLTLSTILQLNCSSKEIVKNEDIDNMDIGELAFPDSNKFIIIKDEIINIWGYLMNSKKFDYIKNLNLKPDLQVIYYLETYNPITGLYSIDIDRMPPLIMIDKNEDGVHDEVYIYDTKKQQYEFLPKPR